MSRISISAVSWAGFFLVEVGRVEYSTFMEITLQAWWLPYQVESVSQTNFYIREKGLPSNFPYDLNTYTGFGGVLLMMGIEGPMANDLSCPVEATQNIVLSIDADNFEAICSSCGSRYNPLTGAGGPVSGVAIKNKVGMWQYRANPSNGSHMIAN